MHYYCPVCKQKLTADDMVFKKSPEQVSTATLYSLKCNCSYISIHDGSFAEIKTKEEKQAEFKRLVFNIQCHLTWNCAI